MRIIITFATIIVFLALGLMNLKLFGESLNQEFIKFAVVALIAESVVILFLLILHWKRLNLIVHCFWLSLKKEKVRFSMSYLYRIKIDGKYLLVKNSNYEQQYQLVGGKYKRLGITEGVLKDFEIRDDTKIQDTAKVKNDFALFVPAGKAIKFIDWFNTGKNREISHWREFYEELVETELSHDNFPYVNYNFVGSVVTPVRYTKAFRCAEILQYDILDLIPNAEQEKELRQLLAKGDSDYIKWADEELIQNLGHCQQAKRSRYSIGPHTKWALDLKWSR